VGSEVVVRNYQDLIVWQKSMLLVELVYKATVQFPKQEYYGLLVEISKMLAGLRKKLNTIN